MKKNLKCEQQIISNICQTFVNSLVCWAVKEWKIRLKFRNDSTLSTSS